MIMYNLEHEKIWFIILLFFIKHELFTINEKEEYIKIKSEFMRMAKKSKINMLYYNSWLFVRNIIITRMDKIKMYDVFQETYKLDFNI